MKKTFVMALAIFSVLMMSGCRSSKTLTEATTVASPAEVQEVTNSPIVYTNPQRTNNATAQPGDRTETVSLVNSADAALLKDYNVVVGAFGSKANAENWKSVMVGRGYQAFLVQNPNGLYRVVAGGSNNHAEAVQMRDNIKSKYANDDPGTCPAAWILFPAR